MMKAVFLAVLAFLALSCVAVSAQTDFEIAALEVAGDCHPECRWQCDDPVCPAQCHPVCERPKCQIHCEETECAKCKIHCDKPQCNVRCPKDLCEKNDCPKCETVCAPANCRTQCEAPNAVCTPMCEATKCDWKCKKPVTCPKPKCELVCERPKCAAKKRAAGPSFIETASGDKAENPTCCPCSVQANVAAAMQQASKNGDVEEEMMPSFMEVVHSMKFKEAASAESQCCPCAA